MSIKNNTETLQSILDTVNALPEANSGIELPELTNAGTASDLLKDKQLIDAGGNIVTGTVTNKLNSYYKLGATPSFSTGTYNYVEMTVQPNELIMVRDKIVIGTRATAMGNATVEDVAEGKTFTSNNGLNVTGTLKLNGQYCWQKCKVKKNWEIITESLGTTPPSDCGSVDYDYYTITDDGYFNLTNDDSAVLNYYHLPTGATNGATKYIYYEAWGYSANTYSKLTVGDTYTEISGNVVSYITSDDNTAYPSNGIADDGYWYILLNGETSSSSVVDTADATAVAEDIANGKTAYVNGVKITGTGTLQTSGSIAKGTAVSDISIGTFTSSKSLSVSYYKDIYAEDGVITYDSTFGSVVFDSSSDTGVVENLKHYYIQVNNNWYYIPDTATCTITGTYSYTVKLSGINPIFILA